MSPTVFRYRSYRFFFFSREETRMHVHITGSDGEAKFWLEPTIALCESYRLSPRVLKELHRVVEQRKDEIIGAWKKHFAG